MRRAFLFAIAKNIHLLRFSNSVNNMNRYKTFKTSRHAKLGSFGIAFVCALLRDRVY